MQVALLIAAAAALVSAVPLVRRLFSRRGERRPPPLFFPFPPAGAGPGIDARPYFVTARATPRVQETVAVETLQAEPVHAAPRPHRTEAARVERPAMEEQAVARDEVEDVDEPVAANGETIRFKRPIDDPVQLLPGRLEILAGEPRPHDIRFVKIPGEPLAVILGRDAGPSARYVALHSGTVSRRHARFAFANGRWAVTSLSRTNPVVVNDAELAGDDDGRVLNDGDRIELGEVVLRFRDR